MISYTYIYRMLNGTSHVPTRKLIRHHEDIYVLTQVADCHFYAFRELEMYSFDLHIRAILLWLQRWRHPKLGLRA